MKLILVLATLFSVNAFAYSDGSYTCEFDNVVRHVEIQSIRYNGIELPYYEEHAFRKVADQDVMEVLYSRKGIATVGFENGFEFLSSDGTQNRIIAFKDNVVSGCKRN